MEEKKLFDGVYFTDYRQQTGGHGATDAANSGNPADKHFVTLEQLQQVKDPAEMAYLLGAVLHRLEWLLESTEFMLKDKDLWTDKDVRQAIEENMPLADKYSAMLAWIIEVPERCHAVTKEDLEQVAKANSKAAELKQLFEEFQASQGLLV